MATSETAKIANTGDAITSDKQPAATLSQQGNAAEIAASTAIDPPATPKSTDEKSAPQEKSLETEKGETADVKETSPLHQLWKASQEHAHKEVWGVQLADPQNHIPSQIIFQKYLNANDGDITKAKEQLKSTLEYRAKMNVSQLVTKNYSLEKFAGLGYITSYDGQTATSDSREVFTWNIYGGVKDIQKSFGDMDAFIEWRVALMEMAMQTLDLATATKPITTENDPYKIYQVHDYKSISFFRSPSSVRAAAKKTVEVLAMVYPETLKEKFFVNVPAVMGFMYGVMKLFVAPKTIKKFHPMSNGGALHAEFGDSKITGLGEKLPVEYGGKGEPLTTVGKELQLE